MICHILKRLYLQTNLYNLHVEIMKLSAQLDWNCEQQTPRCVQSALWFTHTVQLLLSFLVQLQFTFSAKSVCTGVKTKKKKMCLYAQTFILSKTFNIASLQLVIHKEKQSKTMSSVSVMIRSSLWLRREDPNSQVSVGEWNKPSKLAILQAVSDITPELTSSFCPF